MPWLMRLNNMRSSNIEILTPICWAETRQELIDFELSERVPVYREPREDPHLFWGKTHAPGGPLEWCNKPWEADIDKHFTMAPNMLPQMLEGIPTIAELKKSMPPRTRFDRALTT